MVLRISQAVSIALGQMKRQLKTTQLPLLKAIACLAATLSYNSPLIVCTAPPQDLATSALPPIETWHARRNITTFGRPGLVIPAHLPHSHSGQLNTSVEPMCTRRCDSPQH